MNGVLFNYRNEYHLRLLVQSLHVKGYMDFDVILRLTREKLTGKQPLNVGDTFTDHQRYIFVDGFVGDNVRVMAGDPLRIEEMEFFEYSLEELYEICVPDDVDLAFYFTNMGQENLRLTHKQKRNEKM